VLVMSVAAAAGWESPPTRWVFLHGHADCENGDLIDRADVRGPARTWPCGIMPCHVPHRRGTTWPRSTWYSASPRRCVPTLRRDRLDLADPRGLTLTGCCRSSAAAGITTTKMHRHRRDGCSAPPLPGQPRHGRPTRGIMSKYWWSYSTKHGGGDAGPQRPTLAGRDRRLGPSAAQARYADGHGHHRGDPTTSHRRGTAPGTGPSSRPARNARTPTLRARAMIRL